MKKPSMKKIIEYMNKVELGEEITVEEKETIGQYVDDRLDQHKEEEDNE